MSEIEILKEKIDASDAIVIGAGAGLSTAAGFAYSGARFKKYFSDFEAKYHFHDMYSGGFFPFQTDEESMSYWSRFIYINRYMKAPNDTYSILLDAIKDKDFFVITTNVDHMFQRSGFPKERLFYTQGDYGLFQCSLPCSDKTYDNEEIVKEMVESQGYIIKEDGTLEEGNEKILMEVPSSLIPHCPVCGRKMSMNLRSDDTFVEDHGWREAAKRYQEYLEKHRKESVLYLELGVGYNTPSIIKYPFYQMTELNKKAFYVSINKGEAYVPREIEKRSLCINADIRETLLELK